MARLVTPLNTSPFPTRKLHVSVCNGVAPGIAFNRHSVPYRNRSLWHRRSWGVTASMHWLEEILTHVTLTKPLTFQGYQPVPSSASLQDCIHIIQALPDDDSPEILGIHPEATYTCSEIKCQKFIENLITMQPKAVPVHLMIK